MSNTTLPRRGTHVLTVISDKFGPARVEGRAYYAGRTWSVLRYANGYVGYGTSDVLAPVDCTTLITDDLHNNVGRLCNVRGDGAAGHPNRCWKVVSAVSGSRYLVLHLDTDEVRVVGHRDMTNLY